MRFRKSNSTEYSTLFTGRGPVRSRDPGWGLPLREKSSNRRRRRQGREPGKGPGHRSGASPCIRSLTIPSRSGRIQALRIPERKDYPPLVRGFRCGSGRPCPSAVKTSNAERCPSWLKERDWKSRVLLTGGTEGSNPSLSASFHFTLRGDENRVISRSMARPVRSPRTLIKG